MPPFVSPTSIQDPEDGDVATREWGDALNASIDFLYDRPHAIVRRTADQTGIVTATQTAVTWQAAGVEANPIGMWSAAFPTRITVPAGYAGLWEFDTNIGWETNATAGRRYIGLRKNGATLIAVVETPINPPGQAAGHVARKIAMADLDYVETIVFQATGANRSIVVVESAWPVITALQVAA